MQYRAAGLLFFLIVAGGGIVACNGFVGIEHLRPDAGDARPQRSRKHADLSTSSSSFKRTAASIIFFADVPRSERHVWWAMADAMPSPVAQRVRR